MISGDDVYLQIVCGGEGRCEAPGACQKCMLSEDGHCEEQQDGLCICTRCKGSCRDPKSYCNLKEWAENTTVTELHHGPDQPISDGDEIEWAYDRIDEGPVWRIVETPATPEPDELQATPNISNHLESDGESVPDDWAAAESEADADIAAGRVRSLGEPVPVCGTCGGHHYTCATCAARIAAEQVGPPPLPGQNPGHSTGQEPPQTQSQSSTEPDISSDKKPAEREHLTVYLDNLEAAIYAAHSAGQQSMKERVDAAALALRIFTADSHPTYDLSKWVWTIQVLRGGEPHGALIVTEGTPRGASITDALFAAEAAGINADRPNNPAADDGPCAYGDQVRLEKYDHDAAGNWRPMCKQLTRFEAQWGNQLYAAGQHDRDFQLATKCRGRAENAKRGAKDRSGAEAIACAAAAKTLDRLADELDQTGDGQC